MSLARVRSTVLDHLRWKPKKEESSATKREWDVRRLLSTFLLAIGLVLLILAAGAYGRMSREQHRLKWQAQNPGLVTRRMNDQVVLLVIPKVGLEAAVLDGTDKKTLLLAPAHLEHTAWPGQAGNSVIAGHRDTFFRRLHELEKGDDIFVRRGREEFHYRVSRKVIVAPDEVAMIRATPDSRLTLITCYPTYYIGPAPQRLVIVASPEPARKLVQTATPDQP